MRELPKEYILLFNAITEAEESLMQMHQKLIVVQQEAEGLYISDELHVNEDQSEAISA